MGSALSFLRPIVRNDTRPGSPAYFCIALSLERPQAVVAHVETIVVPFKKVHLASRDARKRVGRLALCWTRRHFASSEFEPGWTVCRDTSG